MLTKPNIEQVSAPGASNEQDIVVEEGKLKTVDSKTSSVSEISSGDYDSATGVLTLEMESGEIKRIAGFPTLSSIPPGEKGPQGEPGEDGRDGKDGRDGEKGEAGCQGQVGEKGEEGDPGRDGEDGSPGVPGEAGCAGPKGRRGDKGEKGDKGEPGEKGPQGDPGPEGPPGPPGPPGEPMVIISSVDPGPQTPGTIWVNPDITEDNPVWP